MTVKTRIEDAEHLWGEGRSEGAWVSALVAAAATARKRYPRPATDSHAFKAFVRDIAPIILTGDPANTGPMNVMFYSENRGDNRSLEDIFYNELRCNLLHEAEVKEVGFSESTLVDGRLEAQLTVPTHGPAQIPDFWVLHLIRAVKAAPENVQYFDQGAGASSQSGDPPA